jgi:hypothetical protein
MQRWHGIGAGQGQVGSTFRQRLQQIDLAQTGSRTASTKDRVGALRTCFLNIRNDLMRRQQLEANAMAALQSRELLEQLAGIHRPPSVPITPPSSSSSSSVPSSSSAASAAAVQEGLNVLATIAPLAVTCPDPTVEGGGLAGDHC